MPADTPTAAQLDALARAVEQMTPGPWIHQHPLERTIPYDGEFTLEKYPTAANLLAGSRTVVILLFTGAGTAEQRDADAAGITALVNAAPALLAAAREREELREELSSEKDRADMAELRRDEARAEVVALTTERSAARRLLADEAITVGRLTAERDALREALRVEKKINEYANHTQRCVGDQAQWWNTTSHAEILRTPIPCSCGFKVACEARTLLGAQRGANRMSNPEADDDFREGFYTGPPTEQDVQEVRAALGLGAMNDGRSGPMPSKKPPGEEPQT